jgi:hypothetical protein
MTVLSGPARELHHADEPSGERLVMVIGVVKSGSIRELRAHPATL